MKRDLTDFRKVPRISNFMKIRPVGAELFHADGQIDGQNNVNTFHLSRTLYNIPAAKLTFKTVKWSSNIPFLYSPYSAWWWLPEHAAAFSFNFIFQEQISVYNGHIYSVDLNPDKHNTRYVHYLLSYDMFRSLHSHIFRLTTPAHKWQCFLPSSHFHAFWVHRSDEDP
jgi:hypothetical protein